METETHETAPEEMAEVAEASVLPAKTSWLRILTEFAIFGGIFVWAELAQLMLPIWWGQTQLTLGKMQSSPPVLALLAVAFLWINGGIRELNFSWPKQWKRYLWQLLLVLGGYLAVASAAGWIHDLVWGRSPEADEMFKALTYPGLKSFFQFILPLWAFSEEMFYRAYLIQRMERLTSTWRYSTLLAVFFSSAVFALGHLQYGASTLPFYVFAGFALSGIYLYTGRSLWFVTLIHWLSNAWQITWG